MNNVNDEIYLKYIGAGSYLPDVPARDLTKVETIYHGEGRLLDSRLYELVEKEVKKEEYLENVYETITDKEIEKENKVNEKYTSPGLERLEKQSKKRGK